VLRRICKINCTTTENTERECYNTLMEKDQLEKLVRSFLVSSRETEWVEFKHNNADPEEIGEYISALSNAAALVNEQSGYLIWGIDDSTHQILGTTFNPYSKHKNQELENWLAGMLSPRLDFKIHQLEMDDKSVIVFVIPAANHTPVRFKETEFIRVGSYKKKLKDHPEKERSLWASFQQRNFENDLALENISADQAIGLLDYPAYFHLTQQPLPANRDGIVSRFIDEKFIIAQSDGDFSITNFGAILFARDLNRFGRLARKTVRIIFYRGKGRVEAIREMPGSSGYAIIFNQAVQYINDHLPVHEELQEGTYQREVRMYPDIALRELLANTLIHQDFSIRGAGPAVEVFDDRIEYINPGAPLIEPHRFIDKPPRSRNETLAGFMRRLNLCEERGTGIDKVILAVEAAQLPPPEFLAKDDNTIAILFAEKPLAEMTRPERIRACYQHACVLHESRQRMTNASLRKRLKIADSNYPIASKIIAETLKANLIQLFDSGSASKRDKSYIPNWE
jgi:ATP-dependent DNA helicase RecG